MIKGNKLVYNKKVGVRKKEIIRGIMWYFFKAGTSGLNIT